MARERCGRPRRSRCGTRRPPYALCRWRDRLCGHDLGTGHHLGRHLDRRGGDGLSALKRLLRNSGDGTGSRLIGVGDLSHGGLVVDDRGVVHVGDLRAVHDGRAGNVDIGHVHGAGVVPGNPYVARPQRDPGDSGNSAADLDGRAKSATTNKPDQRRSINGPDAPSAAYDRDSSDSDHSDRAWDPSPSAADVSPASIMEWRETPGSVVDPCPSPGTDEGPMAGVIRRPIKCDARWNPYGTICWIGAPRSIGIEIFVPDNLSGDITRGRRVVFTVIAIRAPTIEVVGIGNIVGAVVNLVRALKCVLLAAAQVVVLAARGYCAGAVAYRDEGFCAIRVHVHAIFTRARNRERDVGSVNLVDLVVPHMQDANISRALRHLNLYGLVGDVQE